MKDGDEIEKVVCILQSAAETFLERGKVYGSSYKDYNGNLLMALFPNGIELKTRHDFNRFACVSTILAKLGRYCNNWHNGGHVDSAHDIINFAAMLEELTSETS